MRRDILEIDNSLDQTLWDAKINLADAEAIRLLLSGGSVVDWQRLAFEEKEQVDNYLLLQWIDLNDSFDSERLRYVFNEAVSYLEEHLKLRIPSEIRNVPDIRQVFLWASSREGFRRKQILSCVILKLMHVIHHMEASDLRFKTPISEEQLFDIAVADILHKAREMRDAGVPVVTFNASRKTRSSVITKLLAKKDTVAATIFDKLRFRIVVPTELDLVPVLAYLTEHFFAFNYVIPAQSHNNLLEPEVLARYLDDPSEVQAMKDEPVQEETGKNEFSGSTYRMINFIVDYPVRLPDEYVGPFAFELGRVVFVMVEFQVLDVETARVNEQGENAHHLYKARQHEVVARRLKRGRGKGPST